MKAMVADMEAQGPRPAALRRTTPLRNAALQPAGPITTRFFANHPTVLQVPELPVDVLIVASKGAAIACHCVLRCPCSDVTDEFIQVPCICSQSAAAP